MTTEPLFVLLTEYQGQRPDVAIYQTREGAEGAIRWLAECDWGNFDTGLPVPPTELAACIQLLTECGYVNVQLIRAELDAEPGTCEPIDLRHLAQEPPQ